MNRTGMAQRRGDLPPFGSAPKGESGGTGREVGKGYPLQLFILISVDDSPAQTVDKIVSDLFPVSGSVFAFEFFRLRDEGRPVSTTTDDLSSLEGFICRSLGVPLIRDQGDRTSFSGLLSR